MTQVYSAGGPPLRQGPRLPSAGLQVLPSEDHSSRQQKGSWTPAAGPVGVGERRGAAGCRRWRRLCALAAWRSRGGGGLTRRLRASLGLRAPLGLKALLRGTSLRASVKRGWRCYEAEDHPRSSNLSEDAVAGREDGRPDPRIRQRLMGFYNGCVHEANGGDDPDALRAPVYIPRGANERRNTWCQRRLI